MKKLNTKGFSHVEALIVVVVLVVIGGVGFYVFNKVQDRSSKAESTTVEQVDAKKPSETKVAGATESAGAESTAESNDIPHARWRLRQDNSFSTGPEFYTYNYFNDSDTNFFISNPNNVNTDPNFSIQGEGIGFYAYSPYSSKGQTITSLRKQTCNVKRKDSKSTCVSAMIYTFDEAVKQKALRNGYNTVDYVTIADFNAFPTQEPGTIPVYRLGKAVTPQKHSYYVYTDSEFERGEYIKKGFTDEGVAFYAPWSPGNY